MRHRHAHRLTEGPSRVTPYYQDDLVTIYHGDCREWMPEADVIVTDPPYGVGAGSRRWGEDSNAPVIIGEPKMNRASDRVITQEDVAVRSDVLRRHRGPALVFGSWRAPRPAGTLMRLVWDKAVIGTGGFGPWRPSDEEIYVIGKGWVETRDTPTVIRVQSVANALRDHPNEKPVKLMGELLSWCQPAWTILDPFMGSGSTLVAAKSLGRKSIGIEIDERYCEIAAQRCAQEVLGLEITA